MTFRTRLAALAVLIAAPALLASGCSNEAKAEPAEAACSMTLEVDGMSCAIGCPPAVKEAASSVAGVLKADVDFDHAAAKIDADKTLCADGGEAPIVAAIADVGFSAKLIERGKVGEYATPAPKAATPAEPAGDGAPDAPPAE